MIFINLTISMGVCDNQTHSLTLNWQWTCGSDMDQGIMEVQVSVLTHGPILLFSFVYSVVHFFYILRECDIVDYTIYIT